jgi:hypothetical protein
MLRKFATSIATASIIATMVAPLAFADVTIDGNGKKSENLVVVGQLNVNAVEQSNNTTANTVVVSNASTGGNKANGNTGDGNVTIGTGPATNTTTVTVTGGDNTAVLPDQCGCGDAGDISITGNGKKSKSAVIDLSANVNLVSQKGKTKANTLVVNSAKTGNNKSNGNTGAGNKSIGTGIAANTTAVTVTGGSNSL